MNCPRCGNECIENRTQAKIYYTCLYCHAWVDDAINMDTIINFIQEATRWNSQAGSHMLLEPMMRAVVRALRGSPEDMLAIARDVFGWRDEREIVKETPRRIPSKRIIRA